MLHTTGTGSAGSRARATQGAKCPGVTRLMLWAPWRISSRNISPKRSTVTGFPTPWAEISWFWQNTQPRVQPEKNTVPLPRVPLITGSSHI